MIPTISLRDIVDICETGSRPKGGVKKIREGVPSLGGEHLNSDGGFDLENVRYVPDSFASRMTRGRISMGDILVVKDGATSGKVSFVRPDFPYKHAVLNEHVFRLRPNSEFDPSYLFYFLFSRDGKQQILSDFRGAAQGGISQSFLDKVNVPVFGAKTQKRIVKKIEELLLELDSGINDVQRSQKKLRRYRASVLTAACSGKLVPTEAEIAKKENRLYQSGTDLLERVVEDRRARWSGRRKYKEPAVPAKSGLDLPDGWAWMSIDHLVAPKEGSLRRGPFGSTLRKEFFVRKGYPVYEQQHAIYGDFEDFRYYVNRKKFEELVAFHVSPGDLIISCSGTIGRIATVPKDAPTGVINQALLKITLNPEVILVDYFKIAFEVNLRLLSVRGTGMSNLSGIEELRKLAFPVPTISEQKRIVAEVQRKMSATDQIETALSGNLRRATRLRQSILQQAFTGNLVSQDHADEPASALLERIQSQRAASLPRKAVLSERRSKTTAK